MENRRQASVDLVNQLGEVNMRDLKNLFPKVSEVTLRKDLRCLDEAKKLVRIHGGAKSIQDIAGYGSNFAMRKSLQQEEKSLIAPCPAQAAGAGESPLHRYEQDRKTYEGLLTINSSMVLR